MTTISKHELVGSWQLESWTIAYSDRDDCSYPFGENPQGLLIYSEDGWMSAAINRSERQLLPSGSSPRSLPGETIVRAYSSYFHYAGRYRVKDADVVHCVTQSLNPNFPGTEQLRHAKLDGSTLILSGEEQVGEVTRFHSLAWHRVPAQDGL